MSRLFLIPEKGIHVILWVLRRKEAGFAEKHSAHLCCWSPAGTQQQRSTATDVSSVRTDLW